MRPAKQIFRAALLISMCALSSIASATPYEIQLKSGTLAPEVGRFELPTSVPFGLEAGIVHAVVQLNEPLGRGDRERLRTHGIELLEFMPDRAYTAAIRTDVTPDVMNDLGIRSIFPLTVADKIHPRVTDGNFGPWSEIGTNERIFSVYLMGDANLERAVQKLESAGFKTGTRFESSNALLVACVPKDVFELAAMDFVLFIDEASPPLSENNNIVRQRSNVDSLHNAPYNLSGEGVTILIYDGGTADSTHPDFGTRMQLAEDTVVAGHATHVAGTVGGDGSQSGGLRRGMAPGVHLISGFYNVCSPYCFYDSPNDVTDDFTHARVTFGIELTTASLGANVAPNGYDCSWLGDYELTSATLDELALSTVDLPLIQFWAAGNERNDGGCGVSSYRCMSVPAGAKNIITVGATTSSDGPASFSSYGPTDDGRIKPEVVAMGVGVNSCAPGPGYGYVAMSGTSMATPATSGVACLILEAWHNMFSGSPDPLPETMKAILINSANDIQNAGPDYATGFGLVNATRAVRNVQAGGVLESALEIDEEYTRTFTVPAGLPVLDVSLAWSDVPAAGNVVPTLVNDLDLTIVGPNAATYYPWILDPTNPGSVAISGEDHINVCERVHVESPAAGQWTLRVNGTLNGSESQRFGVSSNVTLVAEWAIIAGQITNGDGPGVPGMVTIRGSSQIDLTDADGNYQFSVPANTSYTLDAIAYGFVPMNATVNVIGGMVTQNFPLDAADSGTINGTVRNQFGAALAGANVNFSFPNAAIPPIVTDGNGAFTVQLPGANSYDVVAEYIGRSAEASVTVPENGSVPLDIVIMDSRYSPAGPDEYGYYCYEETDTGLTAEYDYTSILPSQGGNGTLIAAGAGNDWTIEVPLPFTVQFYGQDYTSVTVAADGWVGLGATVTGTRTFVNLPIPMDSLPNAIICVFWDDLFPYDVDEGGEVGYYNDVAAGRFIIEYFEVPHYNPRTQKVTGQLIFYTQAVRPTVTGDAEFDILYDRFDYVGPGDGTDADASIGLENEDGSVGLQVVYNGDWNINNFPSTPESALRFTTGLFSGYGSVQGQITAVPPPADMIDFVLTFGDYTINPAADGSFFADSIIARQYRMTITLAGYESLESDLFTIIVDDTAMVDFETYRLDPATSLNGQYFSELNEIHLDWVGPTWDNLSSPRPHDNPLDEFITFDVNIQGREVVGSTQEPTFIYTPPTVGNYNIWITCRYEGGTSDTSNHVRILVLPNDANNLPDIPTEFYVSQNYPNPFNPTTQIEFGLPAAAHVKLEVFDVLGRRVALPADGFMPAGRHIVEFNAAGMGTGVYFYRLSAGDFQQIRKMLFIR